MDERCRSSLPPEGQAIWDDFNLEGSAGGTVHIRRGSDEADLPIQVVVSAHPQQARMTYRRFPYEITGVEGELRFDSRRKLMSFVDLNGHHGPHKISGNGAVELSGGGLFTLNLSTSSLVVDDDLVAAMSESSQALLEDFRFQGEAAIDVAIQTTDTGELDVTTDVELIQASVNHKRFPYQLNLAEGGRIRLVGDHTLMFSDIRTPPGARPQVLFSGSMTTERSRRDLGFDFDLSDVEFDTRLVDALPPELRRFVENIGFSGTYRGKVKGNFEFDELDPNYVKLNYSGTEIEADEAAVNFGLGVKDISAKGEFFGEKLSDKPHRLWGHVDVSSAWFNRLNLKDVKIDFIHGAEHDAVREARYSKSANASSDEYRLPQRFLPRLIPEKVGDTFQALIHSTNVYGGQVDGFIYVDAGAAHDIAGDFVAKGIQVALAAEDVFGSSASDTKGAASGFVNFEGRAQNVYSIVGKGRGEIKKARLVQLPLFIGLLGALFGDPSEGQFFKSVLIEYSIKDGQFVVGRNDIRINSRGIKLLGSGTMDFGGKLDLVFLPRFFGVQVPGVEQFLELIKRGAAKIAVTGDLKDPQFEFVTVGVGLPIGADSGEAEKKVRLPSDQRSSSKEAKPKEDERPAVESSSPDELKPAEPRANSASGEKNPGKTSSSEE